MNPVPLLMRGIAERLTAHEANVVQSIGAPVTPALKVCEKLRPYLATLMGSSGFYGLLSRALAVSRGENAWLRTLEVKPDGTIQPLDEAETTADPQIIAEGGVILVTSLLGLLTAFVGENLTLRMVREVWPELSAAELNFKTGD